MRASLCIYHPLGAHVIASGGAPCAAPRARAARGRADGRGRTDGRAGAMGVMRGLKSLIVKSSPGKLVKSKFRAGYRATGEDGKVRGPKLRGVARMLDEHVFSGAQLPTQTGEGPSGLGGGFWGGDGRRRGAAVDAQVSRLAKSTQSVRNSSRQLQLTRVTFNALAYHNLEPIEAQRVVLDERRRLATAIDVVCLNRDRDDEVVLVELKTGFMGDRAMPARDSCGKVIKMRAPLTTARDCALHRHLAQLAATRELFVREAATMKALHKKGITRVVGILLYVTPSGSEIHRLPTWWSKRGERILEHLAGC